MKFIIFLNTLYIFWNTNLFASSFFPNMCQINFINQNISDSLIRESIKNLKPSEELSSKKNREDLEELLISVSLSANPEPDTAFLEGFKTYLLSNLWKELSTSNKKKLIIKRETSGCKDFLENKITLEEKYSLQILPNSYKNQFSNVCESNERNFHNLGRYLSDEITLDFLLENLKFSSKNKLANEFGNLCQIWFEYEKNHKKKPKKIKIDKINRVKFIENIKENNKLKLSNKFFNLFDTHFLDNPFNADTEIALEKLQDIREFLLEKKAGFDPNLQELVLMLEGFSEETKEKYKSFIKKEIYDHGKYLSQKLLNLLPEIRRFVAARSMFLDDVIYKSKLKDPIIDSLFSFRITDFEKMLYQVGSETDFLKIDLIEIFKDVLAWQKIAQFQIETSKNKELKQKFIKYFKHDKNEYSDRKKAEDKKEIIDITSIKFLDDFFESNQESMWLFTDTYIDFKSKLNEKIFSSDKNFYYILEEQPNFITIKRKKNSYFFQKEEIKKIYCDNNFLSVDSKNDFFKFLISNPMESEKMSIWQENHLYRSFFIQLQKYVLRAREGDISKFNLRPMYMFILTDEKYFELTQAVLTRSLIYLEFKEYFQNHFDRTLNEFTYVKEAQEWVEETIEKNKQNWLRFGIEFFNSMKTTIYEEYYIWTLSFNSKFSIYWENQRYYPKIPFIEGIKAAILEEFNYNYSNLLDQDYKNKIENTNKSNRLLQFYFGISKERYDDNIFLKIAKETQVLSMVFDRVPNAEMTLGKKFENFYETLQRAKMYALHRNCIDNFNAYELEELYKKLKFEKEKIIFKVQKNVLSKLSSKINSHKKSLKNHGFSQSLPGKEADDIIWKNLIKNITLQMIREPVLNPHVFDAYIESISSLLEQSL